MQGYALQVLNISNLFLPFYRSPNPLSQEGFRPLSKSLARSALPLATEGTQESLARDLTEKAGRPHFFRSH